MLNVGLCVYLGVCVCVCVYVCQYVFVPWCYVYARVLAAASMIYLEYKRSVYVSLYMCIYVHKPGICIYT
jgi:hypothetical protein